jgi:5-methylcytosine-specific restriction endonuclease McrA
MRRFLVALLLAAIAISPAVSRTSSSGRSIARGEPRFHRGQARSKVRNNPTTYSRSTSTRCTTCERDANGRIKGNPAARRTIQLSHPCPATGRTTGACPGYVVDHIVPLNRGGKDEPSNMQWQTAAEAKAKDRIE